jgi:hypothetical protein
MATAQQPRTTAEEQKARADRNESRVKLLTALVTLVAAVATSFGVVWGVAAKKAGAATDKADAFSTEVQRLQQSNADLQKQLATTQKALDDLKASAGANRVEPEVSGPASEAGSKIREGSFTLTADYCLDLESTEANWSAAHECPGGGDWDLKFWYSAQVLDGVGADLAKVDKSSRSFAGCQAQTAYTTRVAAKTLVDGTALCVRTADKNYALLDVLRTTVDGAATQEITVHVVVWKG